MLTNFDLIDIAKHYKIDLIDVVMKDELPLKVINGNYILNLQSTKDDAGNLNSGSHWTCMIVKGKQAFFQTVSEPIQAKKFKLILNENKDADLRLTIRLFKI